MELIIIGLNHKSASVETRERLAFSKNRLRDAYSLLNKLPSINASVILSTCNRVEVYCSTEDMLRCIESVKQFLGRYHNVDIKDYEDNLYTYIDEEAVSHLFNVACGLDSLVIGETQILGQIKDAYLFAHSYNATDKFLNVLFQRSFNIAKKIRSMTNIGRGRVSVSSVGIKMAEEILGDLSDKVVLVVGAGKTGRLTVRYLANKGVNSIVLTNRNLSRAEQLSDDFPGKVTAIKFDEFIRYIELADIVISSTSAPHFVIRYEDVSQIIEKRVQRPIFFIDLAVPRDIEPLIADIRGVHLYDIDDLKRIANKNIQLRKEEILTCERMINEYVARFMDWFESQRVGSCFEINSKDEQTAITSSL